MICLICHRICRISDHVISSYNVMNMGKRWYFRFNFRQYNILECNIFATVLMVFTIITAMESVNGQMHVSVAWRTGFCEHHVTWFVSKAFNSVYLVNPVKEWWTSSPTMLLRVARFVSSGHSTRLLWWRHKCASLSQWWSDLHWLFEMWRIWWSIPMRLSRWSHLAQGQVLWLIIDASQIATVAYNNQKRGLAVGQVKTKVLVAKIMVLQKDLARQTNDSKTVSLCTTLSSLYQ